MWINQPEQKTKVKTILRRDETPENRKQNPGDSVRKRAVSRALPRLLRLNAAGMAERFTSVPCPHGPKQPDNPGCSEFLRRDCMRELKKIKMAWAKLNYTTAPGVMIILNLNARDPSVIRFATPRGIAFPGSRIEFNQTMRPGLGPLWPLHSLNR